MVYKLAPDDILGMLRDASRVLTKPHDRETVQRLYESMRVTQPDDWDKRLIAALLAKAGKMHEAEMVAYDMTIRWQRAEALCRMAETLFDGGDPAQAFGLLHAAALEAQQGQDEPNSHDRLDAAAVLGEVAVVYARQGDLQNARKLISEIIDPTRQLRAAEQIDQIENERPAASQSTEVAATSESKPAAKKEPSGKAQPASAKSSKAKATTNKPAGQKKEKSPAKKSKK
jgi:hypothetical protein